MADSTKDSGARHVVGLSALALTQAGVAGAAANSVDLKTSYQATIAAKSAKETLKEVVDAGGKRVTIPPVLASTDAQGDGSFTVHAAGKTLDMVLDAGVLYMKLPATSGTALRRHHALDLAQPEHDRGSRTSGRATRSSFPTDSKVPPRAWPCSSLRHRQASTRCGTTTLFGAHTTEYETTLDLNKVAAASGKPALSPAIQQLEAQYHVSSIPLKVWLDDDKRVRRLVEDVKIPASSSQKAGSAKVRVDITAFDVPVAVTPPPAGQVTDLTQQALSSAQT